MRLRAVWTKISTGKWGVLSSGLAAVVYLFLAIFAVPAWPDVVEMDADEGNNALKAYQLELGYHLNKEVWSDQPPLYAYLLWAIFRCFGFEILSGRVLTLMFTCGLVFALFEVQRRQYGCIAAAVTVTFLVFSQHYSRFCYSVMIGFPALSMAAFSILGLSIWQQRRKWRYLVISGMCLGMSLSLKMFTSFLLILGLAGIGLVWRRRSKGQRSALGMTASGGVWLGAVVLMFAVCMLPVLIHGSLSSLLDSHVGALVKDHVYGKKLFRFVANDWVLYISAVAGGILSLRDKKIATFIFRWWFVIGVIILYFHHPVWPHHVFLISLPACMLSGVLVHHAIKKLAIRLNRTRVTNAVGVAIGLTLLVSTAVMYPNRLDELINYWDREEHEQMERRALQVLEQYRGPERTMVTSRQLLAFHTLSKVPPSLTVTSWKRFRTGLLDTDDIVSLIKAWNVEQVVFNVRYKRRLRKKIRAAIAKTHTRVYYEKKNKRLEIYVRNDIIQNKSTGD